MATTANTTPPTVRGNHPAGRALRGGAAQHPQAPASAAVHPAGRPAVRLRLVGPEVTGPVEAPRAALSGAEPAERWADVVPLWSAAGGPRRRPAAGGRPAGGESPPVRLTRRGRRAVLGLVVAGGVGLAALAGPAVLGAPATGLALAGESSVVVAPGDTLWSIAGAIAPDSDPRAVVDALRSVNDLDGVALVPGQVLLVP